MELYRYDIVCDAIRVGVLRSSNELFHVDHHGWEIRGAYLGTGEDSGLQGVEVSLPSSRIWVSQRGRVMWYVVPPIELLLCIGGCGF